MVRRADAPRPGWYPDPTGRAGLLWWDGTDWTRHRRPTPMATYEHPDEPGEAPPPPGAGDGTPTADQLRARTSAAAAASRRRTETELTDAAAEARRVARTEVDRAVAQATAQLERTRSTWEPRLRGYAKRVKRWARVAAVVVVAYVVLTAWASATLQVGLLEWLGDRVDAVTGVTVSPKALPAPVAR